MLVPPHLLFLIFAHLTGFYIHAGKTSKNVSRCADDQTWNIEAHF